MANTTFPQDSGAPKTGAQFLETIQEARFRAGGPSSSYLLNRAVTAIQEDLTELAEEVSGSVDTLRVVSLALAAQESGLARAYASLNTRISGLSFGTQSTADLSLCERIDTGNTTAEINPLFGQATQTARSRQNVFVVEVPGEQPKIPQQSALRLALQPSIATSAGAVAPLDSAFGEDEYWRYAVQGDSRVFWPIEDQTSTPHMAWIEIALPGNVSGAYHCNELEFIPFPLFSTSLVAVQAEVIGQGWVDLDYSYLTGYDQPTKTVIGLGPMRLCFDRTSITRFRIGLFVQGFFGVSSVRVLDAVYTSPSNVTADFSADSLGTISTITAGGKDPQVLNQMTTSINGSRATIALTSSTSSSTPVLTFLTASH